MEEAVLRLAGDGFRVFVGGRKPVEAAQRIGAIGINISINMQNIRHAIREGTRILQLQTQMEAHYEITRSILNCVGEGVVGVDRDGVVNEVNANAMKLLGRERSEIINQPLQNLLPGLVVDDVLLGKVGRLGEVVSLYGHLLSINCVPITHGRESAGAVLTLQESKQIQNMEFKIRQKSFPRGHVAKKRISDILGQCEIMRDIKRDAVTFAQTESTILITGETGTGKELFAQSIHNISKRNNRPFVAINCASLPENLLESELFGYVKGAFTGASPEGKLGLFEMAHTGTVFLDEISELPLSSQTRLLRVLQEKEVFRLGDDKIIPVDIRVIAATNKDLYRLVKDGRFREDLYFRLSVLILNIPPLRLRKEDLEEYAAHIIREKCEMLGRRMAPLSGQAVKLLQSYDWPGNVRELENVLERAIVMSLGDELEMLPAVMRQCFAAMSGEPSGRKTGGSRRLDKVESEAIMAALEDADGNKTQAAKNLGISSATLWRKLKNMQ